MSPQTHFHAPRTSLSGRIQIGHKVAAEFMCICCGGYANCLSVNIKPPRHPFGFSLAWDWQYMYLNKEGQEIKFNIQNVSILDYFDSFK
jgi:hypothetical protein